MYNRDDGWWPLLTFPENRLHADIEKPMERAMRLLIASVALMALTVSAHAQQQPFVPFTVTQSDYTAMQNFLGDVPSKYANPILQWLQNAESQAVAKQAQNNKETPKGEPAKPEPPKAEPDSAPKP
jgi:hypothetical protein